MPSVCSSLAFLTEQKSESRRIHQSVLHIAARKSPMAVVGLVPLLCLAKFAAIHRRLFNGYSMASSTRS